MMLTLDKNNIKSIVEYLKQASKAYYDGKPFITDEEYDGIRDSLLELDPDHPFLSAVGASLQTGWPTHKHRTLMGSLNKVKTKEEFAKWANDKGSEFLITLKYDGSTVVATYQDGILQTLATRGDGLEGENITLNAQHIKNVPSKLPQSFSGEIRGEAMLRISLFERYFRPLGYSNPRNAANGKVRDMKEDPLKAHVEVMWFDVLPTDRDLKSESEKWQLLIELQLLNVTEMVLFWSRYNIDPLAISDAESIWQVYEKMNTTIRAKLDWEIDGMVVKVNNIDLQESFGMSSNRPKGAIAIKFPSEGKETVIEKITWNRGLTGVYCPTAHLTPVEIGGVTVSKASLCGIEEIRRLNVSVGDKVLVTRRNDVIPKIERVISRPKNRPDHVPPINCELCSEPLITEGAYILCQNQECQGEIYGDLMTWIKELKIKGFGPSMIRALIDEGVTNVVELYKASREVFDRAAGSDKNGLRRYDALHAAKQVRFGTFLSGLNIRALGSTNGQRLEQKFSDIETLMKASIKDLQEIPGIKTNASKIYQGLQDKKAIIEGLSKILIVQGLNASGPLAGKSFCITGDLSIPRPQIQDWIKEQGGEIRSGVSKTLSYLITDDPDSGTGKNQKADEFKIPKISEEELYKLAGTRP